MVVFVGLVILICISHVVIPLFVNPYITAQRGMISTKLKELRQLYWADKIQDCFSMLPNGPGKYTPEPYYDMWYECWNFLWYLECPDDDLKRVKAAMLVSRIVRTARLVLIVFALVWVLSHGLL